MPAVSSSLKARTGNDMSHTIHDPIRNGVNGTIGRKLEVIIVGGGIGGLVAAISLRQQGHNVEVYEQSRLANEIGAAIHMVPNADGVLKQLGIDVADSGAVPCAQVSCSMHSLHWSPV